MPDAVVLKNAAIWLGGYDLGNTINNVGLSLAKAELANSRLGDVAETFDQGLEQITATVSGFQSFGSGEPDPVIYPRLKSDTTTWPLTIAPPEATAAAPGADGNIAYTVVGKQFGLEWGAAHGELLPYNCTSRLASGGSAAIFRQTVLLAKASRTVTTTGTGRQLGSVAATQQIVGVLHMFSVTGGTWTLTIESDDNAGFTTPTTRLTFTGATAITREVKTLAGAVTDDYWRAVLTKSGGTSCIAAALLSIEAL